MEGKNPSPIRSSIHFFSPTVISKTLDAQPTKITHRFIIILECEGKSCGDDNDPSPPRFCVGGKRANADPRTQPVSQLIDIVANPGEISIPSDWERLHQFMYVMGQHTDDHGWQYR